MSHLSVFDLFNIGIGPSSSHTVGPMRAASRFMAGISAKNLAEKVASVRCDLYGSLAATGKGHGTDKAIILGLMGESPDRVDIESIEARLSEINKIKKLLAPWGGPIDFSSKSLDFKRLKPLPLHPNGMHFTALDNAGNPVCDEVFYSMGGGFIATEAELLSTLREKEPSACLFPFPFESGTALLALCEQTGKSIAEITLENELSLRPQNEIEAKLDAIWETMQACVLNGIAASGVLPGGLKVKRRARLLHESLLKKGESALQDPLTILDWVNLYALAVNEENAAGGRVVTAPTNGAAGIIPAVLHYAAKFRHSKYPDGIRRAILTAGSIAILYKKNASISGADVGCQGEVGVACSMAAAALTEYLGGTPLQIENAAEIGMEHNLGLTCDPIGGLVQIPCIERNAMGAVKAINASRIALSGNGSHFVSLDKVIKTMAETGRDMKSKYKETARGGLAVNVIEC